MSYQKSFVIALCITLAVTLVVGLPRWVISKIIQLARRMKRWIRLE